MKKITVNKEILNLETFESEFEDQDIIIHFSAPAVLLYEEINGSNFLDDFNKAFKNFQKIVELSEKAENGNADVTELDMFELMNDPIIADFLMKALPALYAEVENGKFVQNEITYDKAKNSDWLAPACVFINFVPITEEVSKLQIQAMKKMEVVSGRKSTTKKK